MATYKKMTKEQFDAWVINILSICQSIKDSSYIFLACYLIIQLYEIIIVYSYMLVNNVNELSRESTTINQQIVYSLFAKSSSFNDYKIVLTELLTIRNLLSHRCCEPASKLVNTITTEISYNTAYQLLDELNIHPELSTKLSIAIKNLEKPSFASAISKM